MTEYTAENVLDVDGQRAMIRGGSGDNERFNLDEMVHTQLFWDFCGGASSGVLDNDDGTSCLGSSPKGMTYAYLAKVED